MQHLAVDALRVALCCVQFFWLITFKGYYFKNIVIKKGNIESAYSSFNHYCAWLIMLKFLEHINCWLCGFWNLSPGAARILSTVCTTVVKLNSSMQNSLLWIIYRQHKKYMEACHKSLPHQRKNWHFMTLTAASPY